MPVRRQPTRVQLLHDLLRLIFASVVVASVAGVMAYPPTTRPLWIDRPLRVILGLVTEILVLAILREVVPRPKPGAHMLGTTGGYVRWMSSAALADVAMHPVIRGPFWLLHTTRVLYLKALGMRISWSVGLPEHVVVRDPSLVSISPGAQLEPGVVLESSLHGAGRVRVAPIIIGGGCLLGAHAVLMPGATIGHDATVAPGAFLGENAHIGVGANIGEGVRLERGVDLGSYTTVGSRAIISEGAKVGDRARIASGALVEPNAKIGERELWEGAPARRVQAAPREIM